MPSRVLNCTRSRAHVGISVFHRSCFEDRVTERLLGQNTMSTILLYASLEVQLKSAEAERRHSAFEPRESVLVLNTVEGLARVGG